MKTTRFTRLIFTSLMAVGAVIFSAAITLAVPINEDFTAGAEIVGNVTGENGGNPNFGKLVPPSTGTQNFVMDPANGNVLAGAGDGSVGADAARQAGTLNLTGPLGQSVLLASTGGACTGPGGAVDFNTVTFEGTTAGVIALTGALQAQGVAGTLSVAATALGFYTCPFVVDIDFAIPVIP